MNKITKEEFDNLPVVDDYKQCPGYTDYSNVKTTFEWCNFGGWCSFGDECSFGVECSFGERTLFGNTIYQCNGFGRVGRNTLAIPTKEGLYIECGCWCGTLDDFRERVKSVYGENHEYMIMADLFEARYQRLKSEVNDE